MELKINTEDTLNDIIRKHNELLSVNKHLDMDNKKEDIAPSHCTYVLHRDEVKDGNDFVYWKCDNCTHCIDYHGIGKLANYCPTCGKEIVYRDNGALYDEIKWEKLEDTDVAVMGGIKIVPFVAEEKQSTNMFVFSSGKYQEVFLFKNHIWFIDEYATVLTYDDVDKAKIDFDKYFNNVDKYCIYKFTGFTKISKNVNLSRINTYEPN